MEPFLSILNEEFLNAVRLLPRIGLALLVLLGAWMASRMAALATTKLFRSRSLSKTHLRFMVQVARGACLLIGLVAALNLVGMQGLATGVLASGGVTAVVLGFAFREIGENFLAGALLGFDRGFDVGDLISVGDFEGEVKSIDLRTTQIRTPDGQDVFVPNSQLVNGPVVNFTVDGLRRPSFRVGIDYGDDVPRAIRLISEAIVEVADVQPAPSPRVLIAELSDGWVTLEVSLWVDTFKTDAGVAMVRSHCMEATRHTLLTHGFTVSSETTSNVAVEAAEPVPVVVTAPPEAQA